MGESKF
jgi:hypothetical protein